MEPFSTSRVQPSSPQVFFWHGLARSDIPKHLAEAGEASHVRGFCKGSETGQLRGSVKGSKRGPLGLPFEKACTRVLFALVGLICSPKPQTLNPSKPQAI